MVGKVIRDYMEGGAKKLTVPGFGTFMRRENGEVVFVDLLRGDDKILGELVEDRGGYSELEAMALIDRFIFETKHVIERNGSVAIDGFGELTLDHKGVYQFHYSPKPRLVQETAVQERLFETPLPRRGERTTPAAESIPDATAERRPSVDRRPSPTPSARRHPQQRPPVGKPLLRKQQKSNPTKTDRILIIAIVAAAIALIAMMFGLTSGGNMPFLQK
jgi:hypothetical protein